jgi:hypothetical protein
MASQDMKLNFKVKFKKTTMRICANGYLIGKV